MSYSLNNGIRVNTNGVTINKITPKSGGTVSVDGNFVISGNVTASNLTGSVPKDLSLANVTVSESLVVESLTVLGDTSGDFGAGSVPKDLSLANVTISESLQLDTSNVVLGQNAGAEGGTGNIAIGYYAGDNQKASTNGAIAIGQYAGTNKTDLSEQISHSIVIDASATDTSDGVVPLNQGFYVRPVRGISLSDYQTDIGDMSGDVVHDVGAIVYNWSTNEIVYISSV
jgi:hypothetical protein